MRSKHARVADGCRRCRTIGTASSFLTGIVAALTALPSSTSAVFPILRHVVPFMSCSFGVSC
jgi:hypothetical protein